MELINKTEQTEVQTELLRELADVELSLVGGGMGAVLFDD